MNESTKTSVKKTGFLKRFLELLRSIINGKILIQNGMVNAIPFILFIALLTLLYIGNTYFAYRHIREINKARNELKEIRFEYISAKSELINHTKQSEIVRKLEGTGIKESVNPPRKINIDSTDYSKK